MNPIHFIELNKMFSQREAIMSMRYPASAREVVSKVAEVTIYFWIMKVLATTWARRRATIYR